jgi:acyl-coenzyme A thioesterase PaaI-like protein
VKVPEARGNKSGMPGGHAAPGIPENRTLRVFQRLSRFGLGRYIYSRMVNFYAPYTGTIGALVMELRPGLCVTRMRDRRAVQNHLRTVHAIALCNLCEMTMGLAVDASVPPHVRWIPKKMTVEYLKKAKGVLAGECRFDPLAFAPGEMAVPVEIRDGAGDAVVRAAITLYITEKK